MKKSSHSTALMLAINIFLIAAVAVSFTFYNSSYNQKLFDENLRNIANLNQYSASIASSYFETRRDKLGDIKLYVQKNNLTLEQTMSYIDSSTSSIDKGSIQLVDENYNGLAAAKTDEGSFAAISYAYGGYSRLQQVIAGDKAADSVARTPEFTDNLSAVKSFALYMRVLLSDGNGGKVPYTLMLLTKTRDIINLIAIDGGYEDMSSVLIDSKGDYILRNSVFKSTNFFEYLYNYNGLSLDEQKAIEREVTQNGKGELYYKDSKGRQCVFCYELVSGEGWFSVTAVPTSSFHSTGSMNSIVLAMALMMLALLAVDIMWLLILNRKIRISMKKEQKANASKSEFLSRMSHDIRTPLNGIIGSTVLALDENNPQKTDEYLHLIESSGKFLLGLVNDVLDMSKVESGKMTLSLEPYCLDEMSEYLSAVIIPLATEKNIRFESSIAGCNGLAFMLDRLRFNQICFNLLSNSVKFTPDGGLVEFILSADCQHGSSALITVTVRDNGVGMGKEFQEHMFESFTQGKRSVSSGSGTGLGLTIVKNLVDLMDGEIECTSEENKGTCFVIKIKAPVCSNTPANKIVPEQAALFDAINGSRVLLCEDNEMNTLIAVNLLNKKNVDVETAADGEIGFKMFADSAKGYYDAILMDMMMPNMSGIEATAAIRAIDRPDAKNIPIIAMTANAYHTDVEDCLAAGMTAHIAKPIEPNTLFETLGKVLLK